jgi:hydroxymethylbilane synthase
MTTYKIGTRGSLLAVTQSTLMKNELERLSEDKFELVLIKTQGDQITDKPLWQLEGKDFFTKELDEALLKGEVDCVIHSYKDLGSVRPAGIKLAAVTERRFAQDILLIPQGIVEKLKDWKGEFIVGTSSPRRIENLTHSLEDYLPHGEKLGIRCETLRGNVNSRIRKLNEGQYHAITLALAGVERLAFTESSAKELSGLLAGLNYFILPQSVFPSAASQGALGIEVNENRPDNGKLFSIINQLTHKVTSEEVKRERKTFQEFGGGCHLAVGIHVKKIGEMFLHVHAGTVDGKRIEKKWFEGVDYPPLTANQKLFVGLPKGDAPHTLYDEFVKKSPDIKTIDLKNKHVFVTSRYCINSLRVSMDSGPEGIWAAGTKTAKELSKAGIWCNGTSDSLGTIDLEMIKTSRALKMIHSHLDQSWKVLSHENASSELGEVVGTYTRSENPIDPLYVESLKRVGAAFWTSYPQYQSFMRAFPFMQFIHHYCGVGKTWQEFQKANVSVTPVASMQDFYGLHP